MLGIYIHIPFCRSKCAYCDFYSLAGKEHWMDGYQEALLAQIKREAAQLKGYQVDSIYIGGGTPSYYGEERLRELLAALHRHFSVRRSAEITLECNPDSVEKKMLIRLRKLGLNRVSLGMQTADAAQLNMLGRSHSMEQVEAAVRTIRAAKIENLSLDLIYALPGQTMESLRDSLEQALALEPEHMSVYALKLEAGTALEAQIDQYEPLPDEDSQADMYLFLVERLRSAGLRQYEISNFARTGRESRHNLKYWMGREYLGLGPGAHSDLKGERFACRQDVEGYIESICQGSDFLEQTEKIDSSERAREYLMLRLRTLRGIEEWEYRREYYMDFEPIKQRLEFFESQGFCEQSGPRWHFTEEGFLLSNRLIGELLDIQDGALHKAPIEYEVK